jgi:hypothetical protein
VLIFKMKSDLEAWRAGRGPRRARDQIMLAACIYKRIMGRGMVVTSWFRGDHTFHKDGTVFDVRMRDCTEEIRDELTKEFEASGIPAYPIKPGESGQHWHVGDLMTKVSERDDTG